MGSFTPPSSSNTVPLVQSSTTTTAPPLKMCEVCCEVYPHSSMHGCSGCSHKYCRGCLGQYWTGAIFSGSHNRVRCMTGGCPVTATDEDVRSVVQERTYKKMLYFRARDRLASRNDVIWCLREMCWSPILYKEKDRVVQCPECSMKVCVSCENEDHPGAPCEAKRVKKMDTVTFKGWAVLHTKTCPRCQCRIQRNLGCSHMTCSRCNAYFCWRCKGFLPNGWPLQGRACFCEKVVNGVVYSSLVAAGVIGSPLILVAALVGGPPYGIYKFIKAKRGKKSYKAPHTPLLEVRDSLSVQVSLQEQEGRRRARVASPTSEDATVCSLSMSSPILTSRDGVEGPRRSNVDAMSGKAGGAGGDTDDMSQLTDDSFSPMDPNVIAKELAASQRAD